MSTSPIGRVFPAVAGSALVKVGIPTGDNFSMFDGSVPVASLLSLPYKVYIALLTQSGGDNPGEANYTNLLPLVIGQTYKISASTDADFTNVGAPNNDIDTCFVATGDTPKSWGTDGALLFNLGAPTVTILENTLGVLPTWFYDSEGMYHCSTYADVFTTGKTYIQMSMGDFNGGTSNVFLNKSVTSPTYFGIKVCSSAGVKIDSGLYDTALEIRVYN